jgi:bifunctional non-homologous end joining protein LigD
VLEEYQRKRSPQRTPEPFGGATRMTSPGAGMFVVQKHHARRLHYDFRLEMEGVLRSWAVPKGPSLNPADKRLAVMVEDHPLDYANFEGVIPAGNYGAGAVIVWDRGAYRVVDPPGDAAGGVRAGKLDIELHGFKLQGAYTMVRTSGRGRAGGGGGRSARARDDKPQWLLIKKRDQFASAEGDVLEDRPRSVLSGLTVEEMREPGALAAAITAELERLRAPELTAPLVPKRFPFGLARLVREPVSGEQWLYELKYDGVRAFALRDGGTVRIVGRSGADFSANYPELALALGALPCARFVLDGEIITPGAGGRPSFQLLQRRIQARDPDEIARLALAAPVFYHAFDLLAFERFDLRGLALEVRKAMLRRLIHDEGPLRYLDHHTGDGRAFYEAVCEAGLEGVVAKLRRAAYPAGRTGAWVKIKCPTVGRFVIGGWTEPAGARAHFGALLLGQYEAPGILRFVGRVGTGFDEDALRALGEKMRARAIGDSPFRRPRAGEPVPPRGAHFCAPGMVCEVRFSEWTDDGALRHPSFVGLVAGADPAECIYQGPGAQAAAPASARAPGGARAEPSPSVLREDEGGGRARKRGISAHAALSRDRACDSSEGQAVENSKAALSDIKSRRSTLTPTLSQDWERAQIKSSPTMEPTPAAPSLAAPPEPSRVKITHPDKVFWPGEGYTKGDLIAYYEAIAPWMLPYLKDRPVVLTRYPDGIEGKSFFQKDAPEYAPAWIRRERIYSEDSRREISYFILDTAEALVYVANLGAIPIHIWSSHLPSLDSPDWLLFDLDPKGSTTAQAVRVAREVGAVLRAAGMRPCVKSSGQAGLHVMVGLKPGYTYEHARMFSELVARMVLERAPQAATLEREVAARAGKVYIDYLQLGQGKTIAAPFAVRPQPGAPVSAPLRWGELKTGLNPGRFNIKTMAPRMKRLGGDPFLGVLEDQQALEPALAKVESLLRGK